MITKNKTWLETNGHSLSELLSPDTLDRFASELEKIKKHVRAFSDDEALRKEGTQQALALSNSLRCHAG